MSNVPHTAGRIVRNGLSFEQRGFTRIPNDWLRDRRLSYRALGILVHLMSHAEGWSQTIRELAANVRDKDENAREGMAGVRTALHELEAYGYVSREQTGGRGGQKFGGNVWTLSDPFEEGAKPVDKSPRRPMALVPPVEPDTTDGDGKPRSAPSCDFRDTESRTTESRATESRDAETPSTGNRTTTEEHSSEDQVEDSTHNPGTVSNMSTEGRSGVSQIQAGLCMQSPSGAHWIDAVSGYCAHCGQRITSGPIGASA